MIITTLLSILNKFSPRREEMDVVVDEAPMDVAAAEPDQVINAEPNNTVEMITAPPPQGQGFNTPVARPTPSEPRGGFAQEILDLIQVENKNALMPSCSNARHIATVTVRTVRQAFFQRLLTIPGFNST
ncbi:hypothetical protein Y032_0070g481 [Ancylostoma ceylanicum]|uniref:Uncharacterized protein n=1 Tax=Ancylostoma ceylanicum TaxID=53326 RepID=A0A016TYZ3_9BILA|nr:hypothetical protein Y032_0070g481 [Ancylostoma ceylanicum]